MDIGKQSIVSAKKSPVHSLSTNVEDFQQISVEIAQKSPFRLLSANVEDFQLISVDIEIFMK